MVMNQPTPVARLPRMDLRAAHHGPRSPREGCSVDTKRDRFHQLYTTPEKSKAKPKEPRKALAAPQEPTTTATVATTAPNTSPRPSSPLPHGVTRLVSGTLGGRVSRQPASPLAHQLFHSTAVAATGVCREQVAEPVFKRLAVRQWALLDSVEQAEEGAEEEEEATTGSPTPSRRARAVPCFRRMRSPCRGSDHRPASGRECSVTGDDDTSQDPGISSGTSSDAGPSPRSPHVRFGGTHTCPKSSTEQAMEIEAKLDHLLTCKTLRPEARVQLLREIESLEAAYAAATTAARQPNSKPEPTKRNMDAVVARLSKPRKHHSPEPQPAPRPTPNPAYKDVRSRVFDPLKQPQRRDQGPQSTGKGEACHRSRSAAPPAPMCVTESLEYQRWAAKNGFADLQGFSIHQPSNQWQVEAEAHPPARPWCSTAASPSTAWSAAPPSSLHSPFAARPDNDQAARWAQAGRDPPCRPRSEWL